MIRARFYIKKSDCGNDYRPVKWPIKYPYWCSGESDDSFILVAYAEDEDSIKELWPEAYDINVLEKDTEIRFTLRFPKPEWYELHAFIDYKRGIYPHPYLKSSSPDFCLQDSNN